MKLICPYPHSSSAPPAIFDVHTVALEKYFEGDARENHIQVAEATANEGEEVRVLFHGDSPEAWQALLRIIYLHHEAKHIPVGFDVNSAIKERGGRRFSEFR